MPKIIDHDPREPSRKVLKVIGIVTAVLALAIYIPLIFGVRWLASFLPSEIVSAFGFAALCSSAAFFAGRWDARHELGLARPVSQWWKEALLPVLKRLGYLLMLAPLAVYLLPVASWRKARDEGDGLYVRVMSFLTGLVLGFMATLASILVIMAPIQIVLGY